MKKKKNEDLIKICHDNGLVQDASGKLVEILTKKSLLELLNQFFNEKNFEVIETTKQKTASATDLITISRNLTKLLNQIPDIENMTNVIIENQLVDRMRTIQGILTQYFVLKNENTKIEYISSINKLKNFEKIKTSENDEKTSSSQKSEYKKHKSDAVFHTTNILEETTNQFHEWKLKYNETKKKDDMADSFLQLVWYLQNNNFIYLEKYNIRCV